MNGEWIKRGGLECLAFLPGNVPPKWTFVVFHGYGANAMDLSSLRHDLWSSAKGAIAWYFPQGPLAPWGGGEPGRAWFPIDEAVLLQGRTSDWRDMDPKALKDARERVLRFLAEIQVHPKNLILGGFSQGAMMALEVALWLQPRPKACLLFSSALLAKSRLQEMSTQGEPTPFFQSHGEQDTVLGYAQAQELHEILLEAKWPGDFEAFQGGHEIPENVIRRASEFLRRRLVSES